MPGMTFLKKHDSTPQTSSVKYHLHQYFNGPEDGRPLTNVHASELTKPEGFCPRLYALSDVTKRKPKPRWLTTSERLTFQMGRDQEKNIVNAFADMGKAICHWECLFCGRLYQFTSRPIECDTCHAKRFDPKEVRFESAISGASCGVDMLLALGEPKLRPVELKTMAADRFKSLKAPLAEHRLRTAMYLRIIKESAHSWSNLVGTEKGTVVYVSKSAYGCADDTLKAWGVKESYSPFKEYDVTRADKETDPLLARATVVKQFRAGQIGMPAGICTTSMGKRASTCNCKEACFSGEFPATHTWPGAVS
jgi:hypothetical protein